MILSSDLMSTHNKKSNLTDTAWVELTGSIHATENHEKVEMAFRNILPPTMDDISFQQTVLSGHHSNPVIFISLRINKSADITNILTHIANSLDLIDKQDLARDFSNRLDSDNIFYIKVDKQQAYRGKLALAQGDNTIIIKIKIRQYVKDPKQIAKKLADIGLIEA